MAYTRHGHWIPNTVKSKTKQFKTRNCGGLRSCDVCVQDVRTLILTPTPSDDI